MLAELKTYNKQWKKKTVWYLFRDIRYKRSIWRIDVRMYFELGTRRCSANPVAYLYILYYVQTCLISVENITYPATFTQTAIVDASKIVRFQCSGSSDRAHLADDR